MLRFTFVEAAFTTGVAVTSTIEADVGGALATFTGLFAVNWEAG